MQPVQGAVRSHYAIYSATCGWIRLVCRTAIRPCASGAYREFENKGLTPDFDPGFDGFRLLSMAEQNDIEKRREIFGRAFNHEDPKEWGSAFSYRELQKAPDYRKEHDLFIVAPDGTYAACCIVWYDDVNRVGHLEPLGTHPSYRRMGLAIQV